VVEELGGGRRPKAVVPVGAAHTWRPYPGTVSGG